MGGSTAELQCILANLHSHEIWEEPAYLEYAKCPLCKEVNHKILNKNMIRYRDRWDSFKSRPKLSSKRRRDLARNGFYFSGLNDIATCYCCDFNISLKTDSAFNAKHLDANNNPCEHARDLKAWCITSDSHTYGNVQKCKEYLEKRFSKIIKKKIKTNLKKKKHAEAYIRSWFENQEAAPTEKPNTEYTATAVSTSSSLLC